MTKLIPRLARRKKRVRAKLLGTADRPRIVVYRSNKYTYAQAVDDETRKTILGVSSVDAEKREGSTKKDAAYEAGKKLANLLQGKNITKVIFDRSRFLYLGRVQKFAEGLREGGIQV